MWYVHAGAVDENIDAAVPLEDVGANPRHGSFVGDVQRRRYSCAVLRGDRTLYLIELGRAPAAHDHAGAGRGQLLGAGASDTTAATRHPRDFSFEHHHLPLSPRRRSWPGGRSRAIPRAISRGLRRPRYSAAFAIWPATARPPSPAVTATVSPSTIRPSRMRPARAFCNSRWITRFSGRAP